MSIERIKLAAAAVLAAIILVSAAACLAKCSADGQEEQQQPAEQEEQQQAAQPDAGEAESHADGEKMREVELSQAYALIKRDTWEDPRKGSTLVFTQLRIDDISRDGDIEKWAYRITSAEQSADAEVTVIEAYLCPWEDTFVDPETDDHVRITIEPTSAVEEQGFGSLAKITIESDTGFAFPSDVYYAA